MSLTHALQDEACLSLSVSIAVSDGHADMVKFQFVVKCFFTYSKPIRISTTVECLWGFWLKLPLKHPGHAGSYLRKPPH